MSPDRPGLLPTVLLVDDNPVDRMLALTAFRRAQVRSPIVELCDGEELIDYLLLRGRHASRAEMQAPLVILLDINMPRKNGFDALAELKAHPELRRIPVVMLTTSDAASDIARSYALGANAFITKPLGFVDFLELVKNFAAWWLTSATLPPAPRRIDATTERPST